MHIEQLSQQDISRHLEALESRYNALAERNLSLDLTRGKPGSEQLDLCNHLDGILGGGYRSATGIDVRNYGGLDGLSEARQLFSTMLGVAPENVLIGGNASLTLMYTVMDFALSVGLRGPATAWGNSDEVRFLCPVPGYDRHFAIC